jgi:hypothetical protein
VTSFTTLAPPPDAGFRTCRPSDLAAIPSRVYSSSSRARVSVTK